MKYIKVDSHHVKEKVMLYEISPSFVNSRDQLANIFTESLRGHWINNICNKVGVYDQYAPT